MNNQVLEGKWTQLRDKAQKRWGRLTGEDLAQIRGQRMELEGKLRERYGLTIDEASDQVESFLDETEAQVDELQDTVQREVHDKSEQLQHRVDEAREEMRQRADEYDSRLEEMAPRDMAQAIESKPFMFVALAALSGLVIGLWIKSFRS
jgi:uncharacterized protein YjbJ (UPF0337 family)